MLDSLRVLDILDVDALAVSVRPRGDAWIGEQVLDVLEGVARAGTGRGQDDVMPIVGQKDAGSGPTHQRCHLVGHVLAEHLIR
jgi:hypothetical protein